MENNVYTDLKVERDDTTLVLTLKRPDSSNALSPDLFAACWKRVAAPNTKFRFPGWQFELALGTRRLTRLVGTDNARDLLIDTKVIQAKRALEIGLVTKVAEPEEWGQILKVAKQRPEALPRNALKQMLALTTVDTRDQDMAVIVAMAGVPGLKQRIIDYKERPKRRSPIEGSLLGLKHLQNLPRAGPSAAQGKTHCRYL